ncbi:hypothetical protein PLESTM_001477400 [Pleodorina starrii]|nr:hypothetical protein PLESTM_001477400 [Pleodorina starrii]
MQQQPPQLQHPQQQPRMQAQEQRHLEAREPEQQQQLCQLASDGLVTQQATQPRSTPVAGPQAGGISAFDIMRQGQLRAASRCHTFFLERTSEGGWLGHCWAKGCATPAQQRLAGSSCWTVTLTVGPSGARAGGGDVGAVGGKETVVLLTNVPPGDGGVVSWTSSRAQGWGSAELLSNDLPPEGRWRGGPSVLKSALQKAVRLGRGACAVRSALHLVKEDGGCAQLLRRLSVVCVEDAILHPGLPLVVWLMAAQAKGFVLGRTHVEALLQLVYQLAMVTVRDGLPDTDPWDSGESAAAAAVAATASGITTQQGPSSLQQVDELALPPAEGCLVKCLLFRASYGGMGGDVRMMRAFAAYWAARFKGAAAHPPCGLGAASCGAPQEGPQPWSQAPQQPGTQAALPGACACMAAQSGTGPNQGDSGGRPVSAHPTLPPGDPGPGRGACDASEVHGHTDMVFDAPGPVGAAAAMAEDQDEDGSGPAAACGGVAFGGDATAAVFVEVRGCSAAGGARHGCDSVGAGAAPDPLGGTRATAGKRGATAACKRGAAQAFFSEAGAPYGQSAAVVSGRGEAASASAGAGPSRELTPAVAGAGVQGPVPDPREREISVCGGVCGADVDGCVSLQAVTLCGGGSQLGARDTYSQLSDAYFAARLQAEDAPPSCSAFVPASQLLAEAINEQRSLHRVAAAAATRQMQQTQQTQLQPVQSWQAHGRSASAGGAAAGGCAPMSSPWQQSGSGGQGPAGPRGASAAAALGAATFASPAGVFSTVSTQLQSTQQQLQHAVAGDLRPRWHCSDGEEAGLGREADGRGDGAAADCGRADGGGRASSWLAYIYGLYDQVPVPAALAGVASVGPMRRSDVPLSAVDFHVSDVVTRLMERPDVVALAPGPKSGGTLAGGEAASAAAAAAAAPEDAEEALKSAMWLFRSSKNPKVWVHRLSPCCRQAAAGGACGEHRRLEAQLEEEEAARRRLAAMWAAAGPWADRFSVNYIARRFGPP